MDDFLYKDKTYQIIGILFEVHKNLGKGFSEIVYKDAIEFEFQQANIPYEREKEYVVNLHHDKVCKNPSTIIKLGLDSQVKVIRK